MSRRLAWTFLISASLISAAGCEDTSVPRESAKGPSEFYELEWSMARVWNEALLSAIRRDLARPTVHARNLFHTSALMYDLWAIYDEKATPYLLGNPAAGEDCAFTAMQRVELWERIEDVEAERSRAISYGMHALLTHRFKDSRAAATVFFFDAAHSDLGYDLEFDSTDFEVGGTRRRSAALGLYAAQCVISYGLTDGSNEQNDYKNAFYESVNGPLEPEKPGNPNITDPNRWQPLLLDIAIDQAGNQIENQPAFVGAEWGWVAPFALEESDRTIYERDGRQWPVYHDPGPPALLRGPGALPDEYRWNHSVVARWSSHLDPNDGVLWDISPSSVGNTGTLPTSIPGLRDFYDVDDGDVMHSGRDINPFTGEPYEPQIVPRGDYTRVLAEFWADGPDSETPPGHWFTILNEAVSDHPALVKRYRGEGPELSDLEWDVKAYFALAGAVHDAAVTCWGVKGYYDYVRPVSAIRFMASRGQSSDPELPRYDPEGLDLVPGHIELVEAGDPLAGDNGENVGKIKLYTWRGPDYVGREDLSPAGVGWILADNWWPYQRPTFVSPPFAGYFSGHSAFSRAAAEVLTLFTGDEYFPGGMGVFDAPKNEFLVFETGPSVDLELQWATYVDASDQTSLSRIWGGIHPPVDDIPGRRIGQIIGPQAFSKADSYFQGTAKR